MLMRFGSIQSHIKYKKNVISFIEEANNHLHINNTNKVILN